MTGALSVKALLAGTPLYAHALPQHLARPHKRQQRLQLTRETHERQSRLHSLQDRATGHAKVCSWSVGCRLPIVFVGLKHFSSKYGPGECSTAVAWQDGKTHLTQTDQQKSAAPVAWQDSNQSCTDRATDISSYSCLAGRYDPLHSQCSMQNTCQM